MEPYASLAGVADLEVIRGAAADHARTPDLLVEVPHGATRRAHYDALAVRLKSVLPADLHCFFHVNTDVGAPEYGRRVADLVVQANPRRTALVVRCLLPRTLVDCNRVVDAASTAPGMTPGIPPYVTDPADLDLLMALYGRYRRLAEDAWGAICGPGGLALVPHTYAPRSVDVSVDADIVASLRAAYEPDRVETWPLRAEVDLISRTAGGERLTPPGAVEALVAGFAAAGLAAAECGTYHLHPATLGAAFAARYPGRSVCLEVRRDLLVKEWTPFQEMEADPEKVHRVARPIADALDAALRACGR